MADWIETFKGVIPPTEYDPAAHMNTQAYVARFDQATWFLLARIGLTPSTVRKRGRRVAVLRQNLRFLQELKGSELVTIESGLIAVGTKHLRFIHRMLDTETGSLLASSECTAVEANMKSGRSVKLTQAHAAKARAMLVTINDADRLDLDLKV